MNQGKLLSYDVTADFPLTDLQNSLTAIETAVLLLDGGKVNHCRTNLDDHTDRIEIEVYNSKQKQAFSLFFFIIIVTDNKIKTMMFFSHDGTGTLSKPSDIAMKICELCGKI